MLPTRAGVGHSESISDAISVSHKKVIAMEDSRSKNGCSRRKQLVSQKSRPKKRKTDL